MCVYTHTHTHTQFGGFPGGTSGKKPTCPHRRCKRYGFKTWVRRIPWSTAWRPTPIFLPGESHGQRSQVGYSPQGRKELGMTEATQQVGIYNLIIEVIDSSNKLVLLVCILSGKLEQNTKYYIFMLFFFFNFFDFFFNNLHSDFLFECYIVLFFSSYVGNPCLHSFPLFNLHIDPTSIFSKCIYYAWFKNESCAVLSCSVVSDSHGLQPARLLCPWDSLGKNTGVACHALLQGNFLTQGLNPGLPHCRQILYYLSHSDFIYFKLNQMIKCIFIFNFLAAPCSTGILVSNQGSNLRPCSGSMAS